MNVSTLIVWYSYISQVFAYSNGACANQNLGKCREREIFPYIAGNFVDDWSWRQNILLHIKEKVVQKPVQRVQQVKVGSVVREKERERENSATHLTVFER